MRRLAETIALLLVACGAPRELKITVPLPATDGFASAVIAIETTSGGLAERAAVALADPAPITFDGDGSPLGITALYYQEDLTSFRLMPGTLEMPPASASAHRLPPPAEIQTGIADRGGFHGWTRLDALPPRLDLPVRDPCPKITARDLTLSSTQTVRFVVKIDAQAMLVGTFDSTELHRVTLDGASRFASTGSVSLLSAWSDGAGTAWFGAKDGLLFQLSSGNLIRPAGPTPDAMVNALVALDGAPAGRPFEMFLAADNGSVETFDGQLRTLIRGPRPEILVDHRVLLWLGPGDVLTSQTSSVVTRLTDGRSVEVLAIADLDKIVAVRLADGSVIIGGYSQSALGNQFFRVDLEHSTASLIGGAGITALRTIAPAGREGFIYFDVRGLGHYYDPLAGFCPEVGVGSAPLDYAAALTSTQVLVGGDTPLGEMTRVHWVELAF